MTTAARIRALPAFLALASAAFALPVAAVEYNRVDPAKSSVVFVSKQMGVAVDGTFKRVSAKAVFDPKQPTKGSAELVIDLASVDTGVPDADEEVVGKDWFDVARHPQASFVSREVRVLGGNRYEAVGDLSIKGVTKSVRAPFTVRETGGKAVFEGSFTILRGDFGVGSGIWADYGTVANEIILRFQIEAGS